MGNLLPMPEIPAANAASAVLSATLPTASLPPSAPLPSASLPSVSLPTAGAATPDTPTGARSADSPIGRLATQVIGTGPGLLLAHGAGGSIEGNYLPILPALAAGHTVVAPDYPGSGATPRSEGPLSLDGLADALVAEAAEAGAETFTLIGYSLGTAVAVRAAVRHPQRVRGLVLTAGFAKADNRLRTSLELWRRLLALGDRRAFAEFVALTAFAPATYEGFAAADLDPLLDDIAASVPVGTPEQAALVGAADTTADLPRVTVPTLVIAPTDDLLVAPGNSRVLADGIPDAEYVELAAGHLPMVERPAEWSGLITAFLARHGL